MRGLGVVAFVLFVVMGCNSVAGIEPAGIRTAGSFEGDAGTNATRNSDPASHAPPVTDGAPAPAPDAGPKAAPGPCDKYPNAKFCNGKCVYIDDPLFGCSPTSCMPCIVPHATATCSRSF